MPIKVTIPSFVNQPIAGFSNKLFFKINKTQKFIFAFCNALPWAKLYGPRLCIAKQYINNFFKEKDYVNNGKKRNRCEQKS